MGYVIKLHLLILLATSLTLKTLYLMFLTGCHPTFSLLILLKLSSLSLVFHNNSLNSIVQSFIYLTTSHSHLLLLLIIYELSMIIISYFLKTSLLFQKSSFFDIRDLRRIHNTVDQTTTCTVATSLIHSKIDYCNSTQSCYYSN